jgi:hypothetical protein
MDTQAAAKCHAGIPIVEYPLIGTKFRFLPSYGIPYERSESEYLGVGKLRFTLSRDFNVSQDTAHISFDIPVCLRYNKSLRRGSSVGRAAD